MTKIKITLVKSGVSVVAELRDDKCPTVIDSLLKVLPFEQDALHAKWAGSEIWTKLSNFPKYEHENETCLPSIGEIIIMPLGGNDVGFDLWYDRGWCFGPTGFQNGAAIGMITEGLSEFAIEAAKLCSEGSQPIRVEKI